jgi:hypothetical protein
VSAGASQSAEPGAEPGAERLRLHQPFVPRRSMLVAWSVGVAQLIVLTAVALMLPEHGSATVTLIDRFGVLAVGLLVLWLLSRFARVRADPREDGLAVRNLLLGRDVHWGEVTRVRFGGGTPWVLLDLSDGETLAVMAVQRADGRHGEQEARRLATLVALHQRTGSGTGTQPAH